jgi:hypothetical protein
MEEEEASGDCLVRFHAVPTSSDSEEQAYVGGCAGDAVDDCDRLYDAVSGGPVYAFARTCGHRLDDEEASGDCIVRFHAVPTSSDSEEQAYVEGCAGDAVADCDELYDLANGGPPYTFARTCGHRLEAEEANGDCAESP